MKIICIDARMWGIKHTGIGRYVENLISNLPSSKEIRIVLIVSQKDMNLPALSSYGKYPAKFHPYSNLAQFEMLWILLKIRPDLLHVPHFTIPVLWPGKIIVTIHDLIKHFSRGPQTTTRHPWLYWIKYFQYLLIVWLAVKRAEKILVPAKYWKNVLMKTYHIPESKISVTYEGVSERFIKIIKPRRKYVIYVGNVYPHKNIPILLQALKKTPDLKLVIVCGRSIFLDRLNDQVRKLNMEKQVTFKHLIDDDELVDLLGHAQVFVTPSLIEGFGLPGLEAMAVGTPVIAANASCLPEIYENAALYFQPDDPDDLAKKIQQVIEDSQLSSKLIKAGLLQVKKYSWKSMADKTWEIYQNV